LFSAGYLSVAVYLIFSFFYTNRNPLQEENHYTTSPREHPTLAPRTTHLPKEIITSVRWLIGTEWSSTHQCTNVDGWCTHRILFSIPVPPQVDFFCLPFLSPRLSFFLHLYFLPASHPVSFSSSFETFPTRTPTTPPVPHRPTHLYIWIKSRLFLIYLFTYKFKMCYSHPHPPTCPTIDLPTNTLNRYLPNPTCMATPTYMESSLYSKRKNTTIKDFKLEITIQ
jgi:hypothetical protein